MYLFKSEEPKTLCLFIVLLITFLPISYASTRNLGYYELEFVHDVFKDKHPDLEIASIEVHLEDQYSTVYFITTKSGIVLWQVISKVLLNRIPTYMQKACTGITRHTFLCEGVYLAGAALITYITDDLFQKSGEYWNAKASGNIGVASLNAKSIEEARIGQRAFAVSASETNFPWQNAQIANFGWGDWGFNEKLLVSLYIPRLLSSYIQYASAIDRKGTPTSLSPSLSPSIDPREINKIVSGLQYRLGEQGISNMLYARQDISETFESELRTMYRIPGHAKLAAGLDNTDEPWFSTRVPFNHGIVFTDIALYYRRGKNYIGFVEWKYIADENSEVGWDDTNVIIRHTGSWTGPLWLKTLYLGVSNSGVQPAEAARLIKIIASL